MTLIRLIFGRKMNSIAAAVQLELARNLESYFARTEFDFVDKTQVKLLRDQISPVYLRTAPLVAIDVEAYERAQLKVTEIGVAVYDPQGQWLLPTPQIKTLHILSKENIRLHNGTYVPDRKYYFNGGTSYSMTARELQTLLDLIFSHYLKERSGILVGHDVKGDIKWLSKLGIQVAPNTPTVDTLKIYQLTTRQNGSLRKILRRMNIPHANLHNAANDAYYTLLAALSICDPEQRRRSELDSVDTEELPTLTKREKFKAKFSDEVTVCGMKEAPSASDFIAM